MQEKLIQKSSGQGIKEKFTVRLTLYSSLECDRKIHPKTYFGLKFKVI